MLQRRASARLAAERWEGNSSLSPCPTQRERKMATASLPRPLSPGRQGGPSCWTARPRGAGGDGVPAALSSLASSLPGFQQHFPKPYAKVLGLSAAEKPSSPPAPAGAQGGRDTNSGGVPSSCYLPTWAEGRNTPVQQNPNQWY